jgi:lambda family phage minor tail protein L
MTVSLNASLLVEKNKLEGSTPIRLLCITYGDTAASKLYWAAWNQNVDYFQPNTATAQTYTAAPIKIGSLKYNKVSEQPTMDVTISNIDRTMVAYLEQNDGLRGRDFTVIRTYDTVLSNASACLTETYYVDGAQSSLKSVRFTLVTKTQLYGIKCPKRLFMRDQCQWKFKGTECAGTATVATPTVNASLASPSLTTCMKTLGSCASVYNNTARYGGWPGIPKGRVIMVT